MRVSHLNNLSVVAAFIFLFTGLASAQTMKVKVVQRQDNETGYSNYIPGHYSSTSNTNLSGTTNTTGQINDSAGNFNATSNTEISGTTTTQGTITAPRQISYSVMGATFSLQLPDGRIAVVNCVSKYKPKGDYINRRSCRTPIVDEITVEFKGKDAKLIWPVSLDGKKTESETYKILGILEK